MLAQAAHAGRCKPENGAHGRGAAREFEDLSRCHLSRLAPRRGGQRGVEAPFVPETGLGASDAAVSGLDRETVPPFHLMVAQAL